MAFSLANILVVLLSLLFQYSLQAEMRTDLPDVFRRHYLLQPDVDFSLDYDLSNGQANFSLNDVFGTDFVLTMAEDLFVFDTEPNEDIEMCDGTVVDRKTRTEGMAYGSIEKKTGLFRGQFVVDGISYYLEEAGKFKGPGNEGRLLLYRGRDVVKAAGRFEPARLPVPPSAHRVVFKGRNSNNVCTMDIRIDNGLWKGDFGQDVNKVRNAVYQNVRTLNSIFSGHFGPPGPTVTFVIGRLAIATDKYCARHGAANVHCGRQGRFRDSEHFLNLFAEQNHADFCLSYLMTHHDFERVLGVAYVGGVCDVRQNVSYNCGFVSQSSKRPQFVSDLTFAHEVAHNLGSDHDESPECLGNSRDGHFLMADFSSNVEKANNRKFSSCSQLSIRNLLTEMYSGRRDNCFVVGRSRLQEGEGAGQHFQSVNDTDHWISAGALKHSLTNQLLLLVAAVGLLATGLGAH